MRMSNLRIYGINVCSNKITRSVRGLRTFGTERKNEQERRTNWNTVVGLEVHAQINSDSKLFSGASTNFGVPINSCVSFFDCATPGTLPLLNRRCVEAGVLTALALNCQLNRVSLFDRKHYFYADLPAGFQITQQRQPLAVDGRVTFHVFTPGIHKQFYVKSSKIKQIQLEQDSGKSLHDHVLGKSLIDLNRAGAPLMELVFEPDLADGEEAAALVKELVIILKTLNTCSCKMEEGGLRVDANISVNRRGESLGVRTEVKNIGSVRAVAAAIKYEIQRQIETREGGGCIVNETLSWDSENQRTVSMRDKEEKQDYRFMPEPNLPPLHLHMHNDLENRDDLVNVHSLRSSLPELPEETRIKLRDTFGLSAHATITIINEDMLLRLFNDVMRENPKRNSRLVANILVVELMTFVNNDELQLASCVITKRHIGDLVDLLQSETINLNTARRVLTELITHPEQMPTKIIEKRNWGLINDEMQLTEMCQAVIERNEKVVKQYKAGKTRAMKALLGEVTKNSDHRANMAKVVTIMARLLK